MSARDDLLEAWCRRLWNELPRAKHQGLDATMPRDLLGASVEALAHGVGRLRGRVARAKRDVAEAEEAGGPRLARAQVRLANAEGDLRRLEAYAVRLREARVAAVAVDCLSANPGLGRYHVDGVDDAPIADLPRCSNGNLGLGSAAAWDAHAAQAAEERELAEFTRARLSENPGLASLLQARRNDPGYDPVDAVYVFAGLTEGEKDCAWLEHHGGMHPAEIAQLTGRQAHAVEELLRRAHYKLRQLARVPAAAEGLCAG